MFEEFSTFNIAHPDKVHQEKTLSILLAVTDSGEAEALSTVLQQLPRQINLILESDSNRVQKILVGEHHPDAIILGDDLPGIEDAGFYVCLSEHACDVPILLIVSEGREGIDSEIIRAGNCRIISREPAQSVRQLLPTLLEKMIGDQEEKKLLKLIQSSFISNAASLRAFFKSYNMPLLVFDLETRKILHSNPEAVKLYGYTVEQFKDLFLDDLRVFESFDNHSHTIKFDAQGTAPVWCETHRSHWGDIFKVEIRSARVTLSGQVTGLLFIRDITYEQKIKAALRESEARYRSMFEESPIPLIEYDWSEVKKSLDALNIPHGMPLDEYFKGCPEKFREVLSKMRVKNLNHSVLDLFSIPDVQTLIQNTWSIINPETYSPFLDCFTKIREGQRRMSGEINLGTPRLERLDIIYNMAMPEEYANTWGMVIVSLTDISSIKRMESSLKQNELFLKNLTGISPNVMFVYNYQESRMTYINRRMEDLINNLPKEAGEIKAESGSGTAMFFVPPYGGKQHIARLKDSKPGEIVEYEFMLPDRHNEKRHYNIREVVIRRDESGNVIETVGNAVNITSLKKTTEELKLMVEEKDLLMRELNHRVKNNLQIIASLLRIQEEGIYDTRDLIMLRESQQRIRTIALIHEKLHRSPEAAKINSVLYLKDLIADLQHAFACPPGVHIEIAVDEIWLEAQEAIACGMIVNELVTNALKHAFRTTKEGKILVSLKREKTGSDGSTWIHLTVSDNGVGLPAKMQQDLLKNFGLRLVSIFVKQIEGDLMVQQEQPGTSFHIRYCPARLTR